MFLIKIYTSNDVPSLLYSHSGTHPHDAVWSKETESMRALLTWIWSMIINRWMEIADKNMQDAICCPTNGDICSQLTAPRST